MPRRAIRPIDAQFPDRIMSNMIKDYIEGNLDENRFLYRAYVTAVDLIGGVLEDDPVPNPPGSIKARIISDAFDADTEDENLGVYWPLFPYDLMPVKETEHVYIIFEDPDTKTHGLWITRIPESNDTHNFNLTPGCKKYLDNNDNGLEPGSAAEQIIQDTNELPTPVEVSDEFITDEEIPRFIARVGDRVIHGSNNTIIIMGRDRPSDVDSGEEDLAGTIDLVAGRADDNDLNFADDASRIYISQLTETDTNLDVQGIGDVSAVGVVDTTPAIIIKSDEIRIIARENTKIICENADITIDAANIDLGLAAGKVNIGRDGDIFIGHEDNAKEAAVLGDTLKTFINDQINQFLSVHTHPTPTGPSGPPSQSPVPFDEGILSKTVKVKE